MKSYRAPLTSSFTRANHLVAGLVGLCATGLFAYLHHEGLDRQRMRTFREQAQLCAAAIDPALRSHPGQALAQLQAPCARLLGFALIDPAGPSITAMHPDEPRFRTTTEALLRDDDRVSLTPAEYAGARHVVGAILLPLSGIESPDAPRVALLMELDAFARAWAASMIWFGVVVMILAQGGAVLLNRWFLRQVARPLDRIAHYAGAEANAAGQPPVLDDPTAGWRELRAVSAKFRELSDEVASIRARAGRVEREAQWKLREREEGFDRILRRAKDQAMVDPLTKLRNRAYLDLELERIFSAHKARGDDMSAVMIDVDHFKYHNDTMGHQSGDDVLAFIGELLRGATRPTDHALRYGGDEFLLLLPETSAAQASAIVERVVRMFGQYSSTLGSTRPPSMSAGVASLYADGADTGLELVLKADRAMYSAKRRGRNGVVTASA